MQIESLKVFCDLAETKSFTKAAQINNVTQSAVSQTISALERRFSSLLIERSKKNFRLTPEGEVFYDYSKRILQTCDALHSKLQEIEDVISGNIRAGDDLQHRPACAAAVCEELPEALPDGQCARGVSRATTRCTRMCWATWWTWAWSPTRPATPGWKSSTCAKTAGSHLPPAASLCRAEIRQGQGAERTEVHQLRAGHSHAQSAG